MYNLVWSRRCPLPPPFGLIQMRANWNCPFLLFCKSAPKQAMGCPEDLQYFVCCKDISIVAGNLMGLECAALEDFISSWPGGHTLPWCYCIRPRRHCLPLGYISLMSSCQSNVLTNRTISPVTCTGGEFMATASARLMIELIASLEWS